MKRRPSRFRLCARRSSAPTRKQFGFAGSPTWVQEVRVVETPKTECKFIDARDAERAATEVISALESIGALEPRVHDRRAIGSARRASKRDRDVWIICETDLEGHITRGTLELLSRGDELASRLGGALVAIGIDNTVSRHSGLLASFGADQVITIDNPALSSYAPETAAEAVAKIVSTHAPWGILIGATERGRDWGPRLAARLNLGLTGDAIDIELDSENRMVALKPAFGGNIVAPIYSKTFPQMATVRPGVLELGAPSEAKRAEVQTMRVEIDSPKSRLIKSALDSRSDHCPTRRRRSCRRYRHWSRRARRRRESRRVRARARRSDVRDSPRDRSRMGAAPVAGRAYR